MGWDPLSVSSLAASIVSVISTAWLQGCDGKCFSVKKPDCKGTCGGTAGARQPSLLHPPLGPLRPATQPPHYTARAARWMCL